MTQSDYTKYYTEEYQKNRHNIKTYDQAVERLKVKGSYEVKKQLLPIISKYVNSNSNVLELGSGWGTLLRLIQDTFLCRVCGLEISALATDVSKNFYKITTESETLESFIVRRREKEFDFVIMYHVLEHVLDPSKVLGQLRKIISSNGHLYLAVPNLVSPDEDISKFFRIEHCYYFTIETLQALLVKNGFNIAEVKTTRTDIQIVAYVGGLKTINGFSSQNYSVKYIIKVVRVAQLRELVKYTLRPIKRLINYVYKK